MQIRQKHWRELGELSKSHFPMLLTIKLVCKLIKPSASVQGVHSAIVWATAHSDHRESERMRWGKAPVKTPDSRLVVTLVCFYHQTRSTECILDNYNKFFTQGSWHCLWICSTFPWELFSARDLARVDWGVLDYENKTLRPLGWTSPFSLTYQMCFLCFALLGWVCLGSTTANLLHIINKYQEIMVRHMSMQRHTWSFIWNRMCFEHRRSIQPPTLLEYHIWDIGASTVSVWHISNVSWQQDHICNPIHMLSHESPQ